MTSTTLREDARLLDAVEAIERTRRLLAVVLDEQGRLAGVLSDGDIRRALLAGRKLEDSAISVMTRRPVTLSSEASDSEVFDFMKRHGIAAIPLIDRRGLFHRVAQLTDFTGVGRPTAGSDGYAYAVVMAGGEGRRLLPLTLNLPKPMIDIGGMPLLERQIRAMVAGGLKKVYISTNYMAHLIEDYFKDGSALGASIEYLREEKRLGTAGALSLLPARPRDPVLVINGDVLTTCDFGKLLSFHLESNAAITVAATVYRVDIPFGVLVLDGHRVADIEEKPSQNFLCNAGMYVLAPGAESLIPSDTEVNMTDVIRTAIERNMVVSVFPIHEYWTDIGSPADLERALSTFRHTAS